MVMTTAMAGLAAPKCVWTTVVLKLAEVLTEEHMTFNLHNVTLVQKVQLHRFHHFQTLPMAQDLQRMFILSQLKTISSPALENDNVLMSQKDRDELTAGLALYLRTVGLGRS